MLLSLRHFRILIFFLLFPAFAAAGEGFDYFANPVTAISDIGFPEETMLLPGGVFRTHCGDFRILPEGEDFNTSCIFSLEEGHFPVVHYDIDSSLPGIHVSAFAAIMPDSSRVAYKASTINLREEFTIFKMRNMVNFIFIRLKNDSPETVTYNLPLEYKLGTGIPMQVDYQSKEFIYFDWMGKEYGILKDSVSFGRKKEILYLCSEPLTDGKNGPEIKAEVFADSELDIVIFLPYFPMSEKDVKRLQEDPEICSLYYAKKYDSWESIWKSSMFISINEKKPVDTFYASQWILIETCLDHIKKHWILRANPFQYDQFYIRDGMHQIRALDLAGHHEIAKKCLDFFLLSCEDNGAFASQPGQGDANGMALYAFGQHYRLTQDNDWAGLVFPRIKKSVEYLELIRNGGLLPVGKMQDNEQVKDSHIVGHNLWAFTGLEAASALARGAGEERFSWKWNWGAGQYYNVLKKALIEAADKNGGVLPPSIEGMDAEAWVPGRFDLQYGFDWGNLALVYPSNMFRPQDTIVSNSIDYFRKYYSEGLFPYPERGNEDQLHHYLSMDITQASLARGDYYDVLNDFYTGYLYHTTNTHGGCERFDLSSARYIPESNLAPHGSFAAKYIELFRNFFIREDGSTLHICSFLAPDWCAPGSVIKVERGPTNFGNISFHIEFDEKLEIAHLQLSPPRKESGCENIVLHVPPFLGLTMVICDGRYITSFDKKSARIPANSRSVDLFFRRSSPPDINYKKTVKKFQAGSVNR
jgi:hypothetical protein